MVVLLVMFTQLGHGASVSVTQQNALQVVGRLADKRPATEQALRGLLVRQGGSDSLMHPADLPYYTKLHPGRVLQRQVIALQKPFSQVSPERFSLLAVALLHRRQAFATSRLMMDFTACTLPLHCLLPAATLQTSMQQALRLAPRWSFFTCTATLRA